jgi:hypothetical protein
MKYGFPTLTLALWAARTAHGSGDASTRNATRRGHIRVAATMRSPAIADDVAAVIAFFERVRGECSGFAGKTGLFKSASRAAQTPAMIRCWAWVTSPLRLSDR